MTEVTEERCGYKAGIARIPCCQPKGHEGPHLYKCAGKYCPGLPWIASNTQHPTSCNFDHSEGR